MAAEGDSPRKLMAPIEKNDEKGGSGKRKRIGFDSLPKDCGALLILAVLLAVIPFVFDNSYFFLFLNVIALNALVVLGLNLLIGSTGQVSLGHAAFYGLGAYLSAIASTTLQWPLPFSFLFAILLVAVTAFLLALPTLRLEGHYLVMATLGFNIIVLILLGELDGITGGACGFPEIPRLHLGDFIIRDDRGFYFFIWSVFLLLFALTLNLSDSRLGRAFKAIHEKELTAETLGIPSHRYKVIVFTLSAVYAGVAGFSYAHYVTFISPKTFDIFYSVQVVTMVVVGGMGSLWGGLAGTVLLTYLPEALHRFEDLRIILYGFILMGVLVFCPSGLVPALLTVFRKSGWKRCACTAETSTDKEGAPRLDRAEKALHTHLLSQGSLNSTPAKQGDRCLLSLQDISLSFGGIQALYGINAQVGLGEIVALIGPNGAGKTSALNIISGLLKPDGGEVLLSRTSLVGLPPHRIAALGIGRTFQTVQIYPNFTVMENVILGYHVSGESGFLAAYLHGPKERQEETLLRERAFDLLGGFDLADKAACPARQLSLFEQKLLEIIRALALSPHILLLDEPVGGLNPRERDKLVECISLLRCFGTGIVLVEHDMNVVMSLADHIMVLQYGRCIASGIPGEIQRNPAVVKAYLGVKGFNRSTETRR